MMPGQNQAVLRQCAAELPALRLGCFLEELPWPLAAVCQRVQLHQQGAHALQHFYGIPELVPLQGDVGDSRVPHTPANVSSTGLRGRRLAEPAAAMAAVIEASRQDLQTLHNIGVGGC